MLQVYILFWDIKNKLRNQIILQFILYLQAYIYILQFILYLQAYNGYIWKSKILEAHILQ